MCSFLGSPLLLLALACWSLAADVVSILNPVELKKAIGSGFATINNLHVSIHFVHIINRSKESYNL